MGVDVLLVTETKLGDVLLHLPGFTFFNVPRPVVNPVLVGSGRNYGGVAMFVRTPLLSHASIWKSCLEHGYVWLQLKGIIHSQTSPFICCCYLPPHDSMYFAHSGVSPSQVLDAIQFDVATLQAAGHLLLIAGDLNARTGQHQDCVVDVLPDVSCMLDVPVTVPTRVNTDVITSPQGKLLLDFCLGSGLVIFNGRCPGDLHGSFTLHSHNGGFSCVDYFLGSPELLSNVHSLRVCPKFLSQITAPLLYL